MVFNATFNNISVVSWRSVFLVEESGVPGGNYRLAASHWQTVLPNAVSSTPRHERDSNSLVVLIGTQGNVNTLFTLSEPFSQFNIQIDAYSSVPFFLIIVIHNFQHNLNCLIIKDKSVKHKPKDTIENKICFITKTLKWFCFPIVRIWVS